ncbi:MAG TPA: hypothetical protein VMT88_09980, partial [Actinomycetes bacterium]|nr:hypothetical protein [Actinomycetes bacterium]
DGPFRPVTPAGVTQILICPVSTGDALPIVIHQAQSVTVDANDPQFSQLIAALSLPKLPSPPTISCISGRPPIVIARTADGIYALQVPTYVCGFERPEVRDAVANVR